MAGYFSEAIAQRGVDNGAFWNPWISAAAAQSSVEPALIKAVISAESAWDPEAVSFNGSSVGIMQINDVAHRLSRDRLLHDYEFNITYGTSVLAEQVRKRGGNLVLALAGYNAGTGRNDLDLQQRYNDNVNGVKNYVDTVLSYLAWFRANDTSWTVTATPAPSGGGGTETPLAPSPKRPPSGSAAEPTTLISLETVPLISPFRPPWLPSCSSAWLGC
jgi:soluble lytic murein transglycosylase-like protein